MLSKDIVFRSIVKNFSKASILHCYNRKRVRLERIFHCYIRSLNFVDFFTRLTIGIEIWASLDNGYGKAHNTTGQRYQFGLRCSTVVNHNSSRIKCIKLLLNQVIFQLFNSCSHGRRNCSTLGLLLLAAIWTCRASISRVFCRLQ